MTSPEWARTTTYVIFAWITLLLAYNVFVVFFTTGGRDASVSYVTYQILKEHPILALALGVVIGHILWKL